MPAHRTCSINSSIFFKFFSLREAKNSIYWALLSSLEDCISLFLFLTSFDWAIGPKLFLTRFAIMTERLSPSPSLWKVIKVLSRFCPPRPLVCSGCSTRGRGCPRQAPRRPLSVGLGHESGTKSSQGGAPGDANSSAICRPCKVGGPITALWQMHSSWAREPREVRFTWANYIRRYPHPERDPF